MGFTPYSALRRPRLLLHCLAWLSRDSRLPKPQRVREQVRKGLRAGRVMRKLEHARGSTRRRHNSACRGSLPASRPPRALPEFALSHHARDSNFLPLRLSRPACPASGRGPGPGRAPAGQFRSGTDAGGGRPGRSGRAFHHRSYPRRPGRSAPFRPGRGDRGS